VASTHLAIMLMIDFQAIPFAKKKQNRSALVETA